MPIENDGQSVAGEPSGQPSVQAPSQLSSDQQIPATPANKARSQDEPIAREIEKELKTGERWLIGIGIATLIINTVIGLIYWFQLGEMRKATEASTEATRLTREALDFSTSQFDRAQIQSISQTTSQYKALQATIRNFRTEERAWIEVESGNPPRTMAVGQPIVSSIQVLNIGKTVALTLKGKIKVELLPLNTSPDFSYEYGHHHCTANAGFIFPEVKTESPVTCTVWDQNADVLRPYLFTDTDRINWHSGNYFIATHGRVDYADSFGVHHWIEFCRMSFREGSPLPISGKGTAACAEHQKTDTNAD